jgi:hypothetical protein
MIDRRNQNESLKQLNRSGFPYQLPSNARSRRPVPVMAGPSPVGSTRGGTMQREPQGSRPQDLGRLHERLSLADRLVELPPQAATRQRVN